MKIKRFFFFCSALLSGCIFGGSKPAGAPIEPESVELYLSRATLVDTDFEQYKLTGSRLFYECGKVQGGRQAPQKQNVIKLDPHELEELYGLATEVAAFANNYELVLDEPGASRNMFDPGQFLLKLEGQTGSLPIRTSLDSVTTDSKTSTTLLKKLGAALRANVLQNIPEQSICGKRKFYDL